MRNHDGISFPALYYLLDDCNVTNRITDLQDKRLFKTILHHVCNQESSNNIDIQPSNILPTNTLNVEICAPPCSRCC